MWPTKKLVTSHKSPANGRISLTNPGSRSLDVNFASCGEHEYRRGMTATRANGRWFDRIEMDICWAAVSVLDIADKLVVLRELATEVAAAGVKRDNEYDRVAAAVVSLRNAADILGHSPSLYEYRHLQNDPELDLTPDGTVRRWLGGSSWNDCLRRALLDAVSDGDFVTLANGDPYSEKELVNAIGEYMADHDGRVPPFTQLIAWMRSPAVQARPGRRPRSLKPFTRLGGYRAVLERNGLVAANAPRFDVGGRVLALSWRFTSEELRGAVNQVASELGRSPREADYRDIRDARRARLVAGDAMLPSVSALKERLGPTWSDVLHAAGQPCAEPTRRARVDRAHSRKPYTRDELVEAIKRAWVSKGEPFTKPAYQAWRREKLAAANSADYHVRIPQAEVICRMFGGWPEACDACLPPAEVRRRRRKTYRE